jgi:uncharacterized protein YndB with AHSA1/START domain
LARFERALVVRRIGIVAKVPDTTVRVAGAREQGRRDGLTRVVEASAIVQLSPQQTWELLEGDEMRRVPELSDSIVAIEDYEMRPDGTPRYVHVGKMGPAKMRFTADYSVFEPPHRIEATILDSPFGGRLPRRLRGGPRRHAGAPPLGHGTEECLLRPAAAAREAADRAFVAAGPEDHRPEGR